jgi:hypothetical protein
VVVVDDGRIVNDRLVDVGVMNHGPVHIHYSGIVSKMTATPFAAGEADAHVTKSVVHTAVIPNVGSPIALMKEVVSAFKSPVGRRPKKAWLRSRYPGARHPIVAIFAISPVARSPEVAIIWAWRLIIYRQGWRRYADADKHSGE